MERGGAFSTEHVNASFGQRARVFPDGGRQAASSRATVAVTVKMKENSLPRIVVIVLCAAVFIAVLVVNALAGAGRGEFGHFVQDARYRVRVNSSV